MYPGWSYANKQHLETPNQRNTEYVLARAMKTKIALYKYQSLKMEFIILFKSNLVYTWHLTF